MTGAEFRAQRSRASATLEQIATRAGVQAKAVEAWEEGARLSYLARRKLDLALWALERDNALARSGLAACPSYDPHDVPPVGDTRAFNAFVEHMQSCELCAARRRWVNEHVRPEPVFGDSVNRVIAFVTRAAGPGDAAALKEVEPRWSNVRGNLLWGISGGVLIGAGFCAIAAIPAAFILLLVLLTCLSQWSGVATSFFVPETARQSPYILLVFPLYLAAGVAGGALVGLLRPLARWRLGAALLGTIAGTLLCAAMAPVINAFSDTKIVPVDYLLTSLLFGILIGGGAAFTGWAPRGTTAPPGGASITGRASA